VNFRQTLVAVSAAAALLVVFVLLAVARPTLRTGHDAWFPRDRVAFLPIHGVILSDEEIVFELQAFLEDPSVRAIVVSIDSPGGGVAPSQSIFQELRRAREEGVPVVASIGSVGASGGYYIALAADSILALPGSVTGSIGVIMEFPDASDLLARVGVGMEVVKSAEHKDAGSPFRRISESDRRSLQAMVSDVFDQFVDVVAAERGLATDSVRVLADGRLLSGRQALAAGLIDGTGNLADAIAVAGRMAGLGDYPEVLFPPQPRRSLLEVVLGVAATDLAGRLRASAESVQGPRLRFMAR
jgi:protease IV